MLLKSLNEYPESHETIRCDTKVLAKNAYGWRILKLHSEMLKDSERNQIRRLEETNERKQTQNYAYPFPLNVMLVIFVLKKSLFLS